MSTLDKKIKEEVKESPTSNNQAGETQKHKEEEVYDRQIRLWGAEAQAKIATCSILYIHMTGLSSEILKNLVLAGVRAVVCDNRPYPEAVADTPSFFLPQSDKRQTSSKVEINGGSKKRQKLHKTVGEAMQKAIEDLNPLLGECRIILEDVEKISSKVFADFDIIVASRISMRLATRIARTLQTSPKKGKFFMADCFGLYGACCIDLGMGHLYRAEKGKDLLPPQLIEPYIPIEDMFQVPLANAVNRFHKSPPPPWLRYRAILEFVEQKKEWPSSVNSNTFPELVLKWIERSSPSLLNISDPLLTSPNLLQELALLSTAEVAPICAVLGGIVSNEVIKAISGRGSPANNVILLDATGRGCNAWSFLLK